MRHTTYPILRQLALLLFAAAGLAGCVREERVGPAPGPDGSVTLEMIIPGFQQPVTRAIDGDKGEAVVQTLDLLVFDNAPDPVLLQRIPVNDFSQGPREDDYRVRYILRMSTLPAAGTLVAVANAREPVAALTDGMTKSQALKALTFSTDFDDTGAGYKWNATSGADYTPIPMYGEIQLGSIDPGRVIDFPLTRMLARIDIENQVDASVFQLWTVYLVNYLIEGYIAPPFNPSNGAIYQEGDSGYPYTNNANPPIPRAASRPSVTMGYDYEQDHESAGPKMEGEIYTYENGKASGDADREAVCLILYGVYNGDLTYYRVDFTLPPDGSTPVDQVQYMPLYRNHNYIVTITAAEGPGYNDFEEALRSTTVLSNLKTTIQRVDLAGIKEIVYNGQYFMGVESRSLDIVWSAARQIHHRVSSNYHDAWTASVIDPDREGSWLRLVSNNTPSVTASGNDINATEGFDLQVTALGTITGIGNSARIAFQAGRLRDTVTITRVPMIDMFARSNVIGKGNSVTFAVTAADNQQIPAWSQGLLFKWGSLIGLSPSSSLPPYNFDSHVIFNPTPIYYGWGGTGLQAWDNIPYAHAIHGFNVPVNTAEDADMFAGYNGSGFNREEGIGDICRYASERGWVAGKWRLPTYAEYRILFEETRLEEAAGSYGNLTANVTDAYRYGTFNPQSGYFLGYGVRYPIDNTATPPDQTSFWPLSGQRYPNGDGKVQYTGSYGFYWTATPYSDVTVRYPYFNQWVWKETNDADRSYAFPVRCIKDY